ncbi:MAG: hypothetical protein A3B91_01975 [Candidatus Yanofskybacteria bacterium RIFCSPHIGHO2_02_FULL_41_29]|uniref:Uncharacterized protein n=1 Tax=Candidatus Yanofskybacteria bacterium RIFCSPHIGHO2_01_FULL_41_53 TaxID=1802663 RepID=A0A1F8EFE1_9BACT|nr:MAG: hypothetical protein A2650_04205 [Candidatus Yanofskybacteria bacterium RIFCSPHIGHO2_01_FULL_41_53]OGN11228.1 MAG: hypothetical protein A3B91_01975 [Candidatus Yanofskybacteria bacterium RIFCSPHIGHO2_02_FULL_41_29]OGN18741.1 MAG: hypothetical protein A3F48_01565 [Candidatus Yanofskybacteria bacterium RIFCSPHIGHO2_12_FULL_41_9]OGN23548.1 MAG: hypothetical protein A2916_01410 [Candidatus Yanofskybacteria bacterium RIFCSPLOWO2_01_FULL_41_67]OGN28390.1 MAG: hypothetical protein A3H54_02740 
MGALIRHATVKEEVISKLNLMKQNNLTANQVRRIKYLKGQIWQLFYELTESYFGIDNQQIRELTDQELEALVSIVIKRAQKTSRILKVLCVVTIIGSVFINDSDNVLFTKYVRELKKMLGSDFDLVKILREYRY